MSKRSGTFVTSWGTRGSGPGQMSGLHGIAVDRNKRVYVADRSNHRIQVFDEKGTFLDQWPNLRQPNEGWEVWFTCLSAASS